MRAAIVLCLQSKRNVLLKLADMMLNLSIVIYYNIEFSI